MGRRFQSQAPYKLKKWEWAYIAAFIDGEGCISLRPRRHDKTRRSPQIRITANQRVKEPLAWIQERLGGGIRLQPNVYGGTWHWALTRREAVRLALKGMYPYLLVKGERAKVAYLITQLGPYDPRLPSLTRKLSSLNCKRTRIETIPIVTEVEVGSHWGEVEEWQ